MNNFLILMCCSCLHVFLTTNWFTKTEYIKVHNLKKLVEQNLNFYQEPLTKISNATKTLFCMTEICSHIPIKENEIL